MKNIAVTTGDLDGIGLEVAVKGLCNLGPQPQVRFFLYRGTSMPTAYRTRLRRHFSVVSAQSTAEALDLAAKPLPRGSLIEIVQETSPALWVEDAGRACLNKNFDSLVTGPLSKPEIIRAGLGDLGHTEILKRLAGQKKAFMAFVGKKFNVVLVSGHLPVSQVESFVTKDILRSAISAALSARWLLGSTSDKKPLGVVGMNPHAGDGGLIGDFDSRVIRQTLRGFGPEVEGPLVPDVAFSPAYWRRYSFYVAQYHDQGLIPFKMIHGFESGVHLTLGLPIRRSSVDHGTAKDIFGKNCANPNSMIEALRWGVRLARKR